MSRLLKITTVVAIIATTLVSCDKKNRKVQYMPDMYESVAGDAYGEASALPQGIEAQEPVVGTISRGHIPYEYPNTNEGYEAAKKELVSPLTPADVDPEKGKKLYEMYCSVCHGKKGDGQGTLVKREKFLGIPNYKDRDITAGSIYHVIMHGKNMMGSHASQLTETERWLVVKHVEELRANLLK